MSITEQKFIMIAEDSSGNILRAFKGTAQEINKEMKREPWKSDPFVKTVSIRTYSLGREVEIIESVTVSIKDIKKYRDSNAQTEKDEKRNVRVSWQE